MKKIILFFAIALLLSEISLFGTDSFNNYKDFYNQYQDLQFDAYNIVPVNNLLLEREGGTFIIDSGVFYFAKPVFNQVTVAVFIGVGNFQFTPPTAIERKQLQRYYEKESFSTEFESLVILFKDETVKEITNAFPSIKSEILPKVNDLYKDCLTYMAYKRMHIYNEEINSNLLDNKTNKFFWAQINRLSIKPVFWIVNPQNEEEVHFERGDWYGGIGHITKTVNQYHLQSDYTSGNADSDSDRKESIFINKRNLIVNVNNDKISNINDEMEIKPIQDSIYWLNFSVFYKMKIDSIFNEKHESLSFYKEEEDNTILIRMKTPLIKNNNYHLNFYYSGKIMHGDENSLALVNSDYWIVSTDFINKIDYKITYKIPAKWDLIAIGNKDTFDSTENTKTYNYSLKDSYCPPYFYLGKFKLLKKDTVGLPPIKIYYSHDNTLSSVDVALTESLKFFKILYGDYPFKEISVIDDQHEYSDGHSGICNINDYYFNNWHTSMANDYLFSSTIAEEWIYNALFSKSYHDQWLRIGLSIYSGILYTQMVLKCNDCLFNYLDESKKSILSTRKSFLGSGIDPGFTSIGYRNFDSDTRGDYYKFTKLKSTWIIHMLRIMLYDLDKLVDNQYFLIMHDFLNAFRFKRASTKDLQTFFEQRLNTDLSWFFNEWLDDNCIPKYTFAYKTTKLNDGKYQIKCRIKQENVPKNFIMPIPIRIVYNKHLYSRLRLVMTGEQAEIDLPILDNEPEKIEFNYLDGVLCEYDTESW